MKPILVFLVLHLSLLSAQSQQWAKEKLAGNDSLRTLEGAQLSLSDAAQLFDAASLLTILGDYESAAVYKAAIVQSYTSKKLFQQTGVISLLAALASFGTDEIPYILPLELHQKARQGGSVSVDSLLLENRKRLLQAALSNFEQVLILDENHLPAHLGKGCALALSGAYEAANDCFKKGIQRCPTQKTTADFIVMQGIVAALQGEQKAAGQFFEQAKTIGSYLATTNLNVLQKKVPSVVPLPGPDPVKGTEQIEWFRLSEVLSTTELGQKIMVTDKISCRIQQKLQSRIFYHALADSPQYTIIQETAANYKGATLRAITLQSTADNIQEAYGVPTFHVAMPEGIVWVYSEQRIFFRFNFQRVLQSWGVYLTSEQ